MKLFYSLDEWLDEPRYAQTTWVQYKRIKRVENMKRLQGAVLSVLKWFVYLGNLGRKP